MKLSLRTLLLITLVVAIIVGGFSAYRNWKFSFVVQPTRVNVYLAEENGIAGTKLIPRGDTYDISVVDGDRIFLWIQTANSYFDNGGEVGVGYAGAAISIGFNSAGSMTYTERNHEFDISVFESDPDRRKIRTEFAETGSGKGSVTLGITTKILGADNNFLSAQHNEIVLENLKPAR